MHHSHLTWTELLTLIRRCEVPDATLVEFLLPLIKACPDCRTHCGAFADLLEAGEVSIEDISPQSVALAYSRRKTAEVWPELEDLDLEWMRRRLRREPARWGIVERLAERCVDLAPSDPDLALATADLALEVAERLPTLNAEADYPEDMDEVPLDEDAQLEALALVHAARANVYRVGERYLLAQREFHKVDRLQVEMPVLGFFARALSLRASLLYDLHEFAEALEALEDAGHLLEGNTHHLETWVRVRLQRAIVLLYSGVPEEALRLTGPLLEAYPSSQHPNRLAYTVLHAHVDALSRVGSVPEAENLLLQLERLCREVGQPEDPTLISWIRARLDFEAGDFNRSLRRYQAVADRWLSLERGYRWSLVTMEMALVHRAAGNTEEIRRLARAALPTLIALRVAPDVYAAFRLLVDSAPLESGLLQRMLRRLERIGLSGFES